MCDEISLWLSVMSRKYCSLALILILTSAWTHDLQARAHVIDLPQGISPFEQAFMMGGAGCQSDLRDKLEAPVWTAVDLPQSSVLANSISPLESLKEESNTQVYLSSDLCYLFMSLQR